MKNKLHTLHGSKTYYKNKKYSWFAKFNQKPQDFFTHSQQAVILNFYLKNL